MALACKCDRCGNFFSPNKNVRVFKIETGLYSLRGDCRGPVETENYELCPTCINEFKLWLKLVNNDKENDKEEEVK